MGPSGCGKTTLLRLIAAQLENSWEAALRRVEACEAGLAQARQIDLTAPTPDFAGIATDLESAWRAPTPLTVSLTAGQSQVGPSTKQSVT